MSEPTPIADHPKISGPTSALSGEHSTARPRWAMPILLVLGGLAGAAGSQVIFQVRDLFQVAPERLGMPPYPPALEREMLLCAVASHALGFGLLGLVICGVLGLGLGALSGSPRAAAGSLLAGGILGLLAGAAGGVSALLIDDALLVVPLDGLFKAMLIHLPNWLLLAVAIAIAAVLFRQRRVPVQQLLVSAIVAGFLAALFYPLLGLILFPAATSDRPIPYEMGLRILCFALGGAVLGVGVARWLRTSAPATS